ncbi:protease inhibitor I42 family protein [Paraburkholderia graminis]|uniref:protease inhibitor I42 family protein n=1 Tax=Paraburkholderia graminis TaxID=60548 RepID=UPI002794A19F|nr:protease inhibitor I42 family protein [Paraburkholderia graminis]MDQ0627133.1 putative secreted protein [Paraburkholderia graminis]
MKIAMPFRRFLCFGLGVVCALSSAAAVCQSAATVERNGRSELEVKLRKGAVLTVLTDAAPVTAYHWVAKIEPMSAMSLEGPSFVDQGVAMPGAPQRTSFQFKALKRGNVILRFAFGIGARVDAQSAIDAFVVRVHIE